MVWDADIMMCIINYLSACRRLKECDKFIKLHGAKNLPAQILAQRDMIEMEQRYYADEIQVLGLVVLVVGVLSVGAFVIYSKYTGAI